MLDILVAELQRSKSFSFDILSQSFAKPIGYAVNTHKSREAIVGNYAALSRTYLSNRIAVYIAENLDVLTRPSHVLGAWLDGNKLFLNITTIVPTRETAELLAREHAQLAFYDLTAGETINARRQP